MDWKILQSENQLTEIIQRSEKVPCLIFKHSTRCPISSMAKNRLETKWEFKQKEIEPYFLDLIQYRNISNTIAENFKVLHESPQILLIQDGSCTFHTSHLDISIEGIKAELSAN